MPKMHQPHLKLLSSHRKNSCGKQDETCQHSLLTRGGNFNITQIHKTNTFKSLHLFACLSFLVTEGPENSSKSETTHILSFHIPATERPPGCSNNQDTDISQLHLKIKAPRAITHTKPNDLQDQISLERL